MSNSLRAHGLQQASLPCIHQFPELAQTHVHWIGDAIQPSHPLSSLSPLAFNLSQHQGLFQWVSSSHQVAKVLEFQHQSFLWIFMGPDVMIFVLWMLSFKPTFSLYCFTFMKRLFSFSSLSALRVVSSVYLRLLNCHMTQQSHCWAYTTRKPELKETHEPQCSLQHCLQ